MYLRNYPKRSNDHISHSYEPGARYQQSLVDLFPCVVDLFTCFLDAFGLEHENPHKNYGDFHEPKQKRIRPLRCKTPYQAPPQMSAQQAAHVTQAVLFATGWNYRPAGGDEVVSRGTLYRKKNTQKGYCWTGGTHFFGFLSYDMACFLDVRKVKPTGSAYWRKLNQ